MVVFQSAPRERGESGSQNSEIHNDNGFNPRPASGAKGLLSAGFLPRLSCFNPRPASGAKVVLELVMEFVFEVSIRAPRAGRKMLELDRETQRPGFNPRPASGAKADLP